MEKGDLGVEVEEKDSQALVEGAKVSISGPEDHTANTDARGVALFSRLTPGTYSVEAKREGLTKDPGTAKATVTANTSIQANVTLSPPKVVELVEIVTHKGTESTQPPKERRQYINLDTSADSNSPHPEYGRSIKFKARVEWTSGDKSTSLKGASVYWYSEADPGNKTGLTGSELEGFDSKGSNIKHKITKTDEKGWTPVVEFYLSRYGGDKFDVYATEDKSYKGGKNAGMHIVWRKLWFEVDTMKKRGGGTLEMNHHELPKIYEQPCFIELEKQGTDNQPDNKWNIMTGELHGFGNDYFGAKKSPFQSHEVAIDHQADKKEEERVFELDGKVYTDGNEESYYVYDGGDSWLKEAKYKDGLLWKSLDKGKVSLVGANKVEKKINIDLSGGPVTPTPSKKVKVSLKFLRSLEYSGDGTYKPHAFVAMGYWMDTETEAEAKKRTVGTMAHELGHLLGMVPPTSSTYILLRTGPHCSDPHCVMYSTNTSTRGNDFCDVCKKELRKADLANCKPSFAHNKGSKA